MTINKSLPIAVMLLCVSGLSFGQGKKTIKEKKITSITVNEYFLDEGMDKPVVESIEKYNEEGELIEIKEFNKRSEVTSWEKYAYNDDGDLVEEVFIDAKGRVTRTEKTVYREDLKVEKKFYNNKDKLYKKKVYKYEYGQ